MKFKLVLILSGVFSFWSCSTLIVPDPKGDAKLSHESEVYIKNLRQLTRGGTNAEAYWSQSGEWLTFQHKGKFKDLSPDAQNNLAEDKCDQIYAIRADGKKLHRISSGQGRTTCSYFYNDFLSKNEGAAPVEKIIYSSTHADSPACPTEPDHSKGYVWPIYPAYQNYSVPFTGNQGTAPATALESSAPRAYTAEATVCDNQIVFTSDRDGDLELYTGTIATQASDQITNIKRVTHQIGYDGGAFFSKDCKKLVWRANHPQSKKEKDEYFSLLKQHLVKPSVMELWVSDADGKHAKQITHNGAANFSPFFTPDAGQIIFASNMGDPQHRQFDLYLIDVSGARLQKVTHTGGFNSFPMFSPDGKYLAFSSSRNALMPRENNVFIADWVPQSKKDISVVSPDPIDRFQAIVEKLSSPQKEGRGLGTQGLDSAEQFLAGQMAVIGLSPFEKSFSKPSSPLVGVTGYFQKVETKDLKTGQVFASNNVIGTYGTGCTNSQESPILIGAHLDHLGGGAENSLNENKKGAHPGADDNASGIAALLEVARQVKGWALTDSHCWIFVGFTAEERGVVGSSHLAQTLKGARRLPKVMLNMDMVGRLENNLVIAFGSDTAKQWAKILKTQCSAHGLICGGGGDGYGPSDHMPFFAAGVPVLHFFTGPHADYHRSSDTAEKISASGGVRVAQFIAAVAGESANPTLRFDYIKAGPRSTMGRLAAQKRTSKGAYLGTIPNYGTMASASGPSGAGSSGEKGGVPLMGVRSGSPAESAGVKEGDILVAIRAKISEENEMTRHPFENLDGYMNILVELEPDQKIALEVVREGKTLVLPAVVGRRESTQ